jgi:HlyD family secretion protein
MMSDAAREPAPKDLTRSTPRGAIADRAPHVVAVAALVLIASACREPAPATPPRVSGHVEATDVHVAAEVAGRILELRVNEGDRVAAGDLLARLDTRDVELQAQRARAERAAADADLRLLRAGARPEEIRQADAQVEAAQADVTTIEAELRAAEIDFERFETLLKANAGSRKQRDDALARVEVARERQRAARERVQAAREAAARLRAGARAEEIDAAQARVAVADAQIAVLRKAVADASVLAPAAGVITQKLAEPGELAAARTPLLVITDIDRAWANLFVPEPMIPRIRLGQQATVFTDAGGPGLPGTVAFVSPQAEFTPRNVQTADERSKLVYRIKVNVDNRSGVLKPGMPVEAEVPVQ